MKSAISLPARLLSLAILIILLSGCVSDKEPAYKTLVGSPLPSFSVALDDGTIVSPATLRGKRVLIEFFNTSCGDCRQSFPVIEEVWRHFSDESGVFVFGIARKEDSSEIRKYWEDNSLSFPFSPQADREVYGKFANSGIPRIYLVNEEGIIFAEYGPENPPTADQLINLLQ